MRRYEHKESPQHQQEHRELLKAMTRFRKKLGAGDDGVGDEVLAFLSGWLSSHMTGSDRALGEAYKARGEGR
jgi:hemerythrin-like metal-binding protein